MTLCLIVAMFFWLYFITNFCDLDDMAIYKTLLYCIDLFCVRKNVYQYFQDILSSPQA